jgi:hypothetical protein
VSLKIVDTEHAWMRPEERAQNGALGEVVIGHGGELMRTRVRLARGECRAPTSRRIASAADAAR